MSLTAINYRNRSTECIIEIGVKEMQGKGVGTAALSLLLDFAFNELNLHRVSLKVLSFNERAIRLYEKLGFVREGAVRQDFYRAGAWHDIILMGMLKDEYQAKAGQGCAAG